MDFASKFMNCALKMMDLAFKMTGFVFKMTDLTTNSVREFRRRCGAEQRVRERRCSGFINNVLFGQRVHWKTIDFVFKMMNFCSSGSRGDVSQRTVDHVCQEFF